MTPDVIGSDRTDPNIHNVRPRRRLRLVRVDSNRGPNNGAPPSQALNQYPFPFDGMWEPARHGHYPVFPVGIARRLGAFRRAGTGTLGGRGATKRS